MTAQTNATNKEQIKKAMNKEEMSREVELSDLAFVLSRPEGRRVLWRLMGYCGVFTSVKDPSGSMTYYNAGQQDVGHFIQAEIMEAKADAYIQMIIEANKEKYNVRSK